MMCTMCATGLSGWIPTSCSAPFGLSSPEMELIENIGFGTMGDGEIILSELSGIFFFKN